MGCMSSSPENKRDHGHGGSKYAQAAVGGDSRSHSMCEHSEVDEMATEAAAFATGAMDYSSWIDLRVAASALKGADLLPLSPLNLKRSAPMAILYELTRAKEWKETARTEVIAGTEAPTFVKAFRLLYNFEQPREYKLELVDVDAQHQDPEHVEAQACRRLGHAQFKMADILTSRDRSLTLDLQNGGKKSQVHITAEELSASRDAITIKLMASDLKKAKMLSQNRPFLEISTVDEHGRWKPVFKTEVSRDSNSPVWESFTIKATQLNNGDPYRPLQLKVFSFVTSGNHVLIGKTETNSMRLMEMIGAAPLPLTDPNQTSPNDYAGAVHVQSFLVSQRPTFLDYLQAGAEINFMVAVDYTASNKDPRDPQSLHYLNPAGGATAYEQAISGVGQVLQAYDKSNMFQSYGFGCKVPGGTVQHCIPLGADGTPACPGIQGILAAYRQALYTYALSGPTLFGPLLRQAAANASQRSGLRYSVLLILTDGCIHDMQDSIDTMVAASSLPLSIIIVGVGSSSELENMKILDSDKQLLVNRHGTVAKRDICQFVNFLDFQNDGVALATALLAELPGQFLEWCGINNVPVPAHLNLQRMSCQ